MPVRPSSLLPVVAVLLIAPEAIIHADSNYAEVRLSGSPLTSPNEGRVEFRPNQTMTWLTVCANEDWDFAAGEEVCQQLGYPGTAMVKNASEYGPATTEIGFKSTRDEASCQDMMETCQDNHTAGVVCAGPGYRGCLNNPNGERDIFNALLNIDDNTIQRCLEHAKSARPDSKPVRYVGLEGSRCWYDKHDSLNFTADRTNDSMCNTLCPGDSNQICGGSDVISVYSVQDSFCDEPNFTNGEIVAEPATGSFYFGTIVNFTCNDESTLNGTSTAQCVLNNSGTEDFGHGVKWNNDTPECNGDEPQVTATTPDCEEDNCSTTPSQATNDVALILSILNTVILFLLIIALLIGLCCCFRRKTECFSWLPSRHEAGTDSVENGVDSQIVSVHPPDLEQGVAAVDAIPDLTSKTNKPLSKDPAANSGLEMHEGSGRPKSSYPDPGRLRKPRSDQDEDRMGTIIINPQSQPMRATWPQTEEQDEEGWTENLNYESLANYANVTK